MVEEPREALPLRVIAGWSSGDRPPSDTTLDQLGACPGKALAAAPADSDPGRGATPAVVSPGQACRSAPVAPLAPGLPASAATPCSPASALCCSFQGSAAFQEGSEFTEAARWPCLIT